MTEPLCPHCKTTAPPWKVGDEWYCESCGCRSERFDQLTQEQAEWSPFPSEKLRQKAAASEDPVQKMIFERLAAAMDADVSRAAGKDSRRIVTEWKKRRMAELETAREMQPEERPTEQRNGPSGQKSLDELFPRPGRPRAFAQAILGLGLKEPGTGAIECCVWLDEHPEFDLPRAWMHGSNERSFEKAYRNNPVASRDIDSALGKAKKKLRDAGWLSRAH